MQTNVRNERVNIYFLTIFSMLACARILATEAKPAIRYAGKWEGSYSEPGHSEVPIKVSLILVGVPFSDYEIKKSDGARGDMDTVTGVLSIDVTKKRGLKSDCKYPEEAHMAFSGIRIQDHIDLYSLLHEEYGALKETRTVHFAVPTGNALNMKFVSVNMRTGLPYTYSATLKRAPGP